MKVLVFNAGSSTLKYHLYQMPGDIQLAKGNIDRIGNDGTTLSFRHGNFENKFAVTVHEHGEGVELILKHLVEQPGRIINDLSEINAAGHRIVHGGPHFTHDVIISDETIKSLYKLNDLAPLHNKPGISCIEAARQMLPNIPHVACFDTVFHNTIPPSAYTYGLPYELCRKYHIRKYGFHGLSHQYVSEEAARFLNKDIKQLNAITCHLGNGCSVAAIKNGSSIDTSMGFTPLEGLVMGTRCGEIDPNIIFFLIDKGYDLKNIAPMLNKESGLLGISGISNDMRTLTKLATEGHTQAKLAIDVFCYRIKKYIGAYIAVIGNPDALVFTGGIGENAALIRRQICSDLTHLGIELDIRQNEITIGSKSCISTPAGYVKVLVIPTNEELLIAKKIFEPAN